MWIKRQKRCSCDFILAILWLPNFFQDGVMIADNSGSTFLMNVYSISVSFKVTFQKKSATFCIFQTWDTQTTSVLYTAKIINF